MSSPARAEGLVNMIKKWLKFNWIVRDLVWLYGISTIVGYLMPNPFLYIKTHPFQTIQFSISIVFGFHSVIVKTVLFQAIQFRISTKFSSIWPIDRALSGATTPEQWTWERWQYRGTLHYPKALELLSDCLVSYLGYSLGVLTPLQRCSQTTGTCLLYITIFEPSNFVELFYIELLEIELSDHLTVCLQIIYLIYI